MNHYKFDPSLNILYKEQNNLDYFFNPNSIAVIGASDREGSVGKILLINLKKSFKKKIYPINLKKNRILNLKAYKSVLAVNDVIDLAVIATPAATVLSVIKECIKANIKACIIVSAGFKELGKKGLELENQILKAARNKIRIIGPNCLGLMNTHAGINATFAKSMAIKGNIAFISQSGALCTAILDYSLKENIGFSSFISIGSMIDVDFGDLISYLSNDKNTKSILLYVENIGNARSFLSAAREAAISKPIILIKSGRTFESKKAAESHTGALAGSDDVLDTALKRVGVLRVDTISELFEMADILAKLPILKGNNLAIVTNAGGPGVIAVDALIKNGGELAPLSKQTFLKLNLVLPSAWSHNNPIDILGDATEKRYVDAIDILLKDKNVDGVLAILTPQYMTDATKIALKLRKFSKSKIPVFASFIGADSVKKGINILSKSKMATFIYPDTACKIFSKMFQYSKNLKSLYETPKKIEFINKNDFYKKNIEIKKIFSRARKAGRYLLDEDESKKVLQLFDIPIVPTFIAKNKKKAIEHAKKIGYPVVLKIYSKDISHKSDFGGVVLNINSDSEVQEAFDKILFSTIKAHSKKAFLGVCVQKMIKDKGFELILGSLKDNEFGPVILFGTGGELVEVYNDKALALHPLNSNLANKLMQNTKIYKALLGYRSRKKIDIKLLEEIIVKFSNLITSYNEIKEFDINPLFVFENKIVALDARIVLHQKNEKIIDAAIRGYPIEYVKEVNLKNDLKTIFRPILPQDESLLKEFYSDISSKSLKETYLKVLHYDELTAHERLFRICFTDYDREIVLVVEDKKTNKIIGIARLTKLLSSKNAKFAILIKDKYHKMGIGSKLLKNLIEISKNEKIEFLISKMFKSNIAMQKICKKLNFKFKMEDGIITGIKKIKN